MDTLNHPSSKEELITGVLGLTPDITFSPVQIQKLFFLLEKKLNLTYFDFKPYHYGPYDKGLTATLDLLSQEGKIHIKNIDGIIHYQASSTNTLNSSDFLDEQKRKFIKKMTAFIKNLSFKELCMSIYKEYPEMAENSIFFRK